MAGKVFCYFSCNGKNALNFNLSVQFKKQMQWHTVTLGEVKLPKKRLPCNLLGFTAQSECRLYIWHCWGKEKLDWAPSSSDLSGLDCQILSVPPIIRTRNGRGRRPSDRDTVYKGSAMLLMLCGNRKVVLNFTGGRKTVPLTLFNWLLLERS